MMRTLLLSLVLGIAAVDGASAQAGAGLGLFQAASNGQRLFSNAPKNVKPGLHARPRSQRQNGTPRSKPNDG